MPCWRRPDDVDEDKWDGADDMLAFERKYCYLKGLKLRNF